ncbi:MAG: CPBP family intramembrane metalloprotease [Candidatus Eremiobacteraeota bacterium]|nr:CPBP family intramembrane metalloprotease [Candidatus Eremiobacteraeota bacterium]
MSTPIALDSRARSIWNAILFWILAEWAIEPQLDKGFAALGKAWHLGNDLSAANTALGELETLVIALGLTALFGYFEGRRFDSYGLPIAQAFRGRFWEGLLVGVAWAGIVALLMVALGGMRVAGLALSNPALLWTALAWFGANLLVGVGEEAWFRGYLLQTLRRGIGFWAAAIVLSLWFTAEHYFFKTGENVWDCISLFAFGMLVCFTVLRTGNLWFGVGLHVSFDFMQLFVIGTRNGAQVPVGHLLNVSFPGPAWVNGGVLGTEASVLMYPAFVAVFLYVALRFPARVTRTE